MIGTFLDLAGDGVFPFFSFAVDENDICQSSIRRMIWGGMLVIKNSQANN